MFSLVLQLVDGHLHLTDGPRYVQCSGEHLVWADTLVLHVQLITTAGRWPLTSDRWTKVCTVYMWANNTNAFWLYANMQKLSGALSKLPNSRLGFDKYVLVLSA